MSKRNQKYVDYVLDSINEINPHTGPNNHIYAEGFLAAVMAELILDDNKNFHKFKQRIDLLKQQRSKD